LDPSASPRTPSFGGGGGGLVVEATDWRWMQELGRQQPEAWRDYLG